MRNCARRLMLLPAFFLTLSYVGGCSSRAPISKDATAKMLLTTLTRHCDRQTVTIRAGRAGMVKTRHAVAWFDKTILNDPVFFRSSVSSESDGRRGSLSYRDGDQMLRVDWSEFTPPDVVERDRLDLRACIYVPDQIDLIDRSFEDGGRKVWVTFRERLRLSIFGQRMREAELFDADLVAAGEPQDYEYQAELEKTKPVGWGVRSIKMR